LVLFSMVCYIGFVLYFHINRNTYFHGENLDEEEATPREQEALKDRQDPFWSFYDVDGQKQLSRDCFHWVVLVLQGVAMIFILLSLSFAWTAVYLKNVNPDESDPKAIDEIRFTAHLWGSACSKTVWANVDREFVSCDDFASFTGGRSRLQTMQAAGIFFLVGVFICFLCLYEQIRNKLPILGRIGLSASCITCMTIAISIYFANGGSAKFNNIFKIDENGAITFRSFQGLSHTWIQEVSDVPEGFQVEAKLREYYYAVIGLVLMIISVIVMYFWTFLDESEKIARNTEMVEQNIQSETEDVGGEQLQQNDDNALSPPEGALKRMVTEVMD